MSSLQFLDRFLELSLLCSYRFTAHPNAFSNRIHRPATSGSRILMLQRRSRRLLQGGYRFYPLRLIGWHPNEEDSSHFLANPVSPMVARGI
jgi:hypothetical protein